MSVISTKAIESERVARVVSVGAAPGHGFSKPVLAEIALLAGLGVQDDAHCGETVKHRSRVKIDPTQANLRQVHLLQGELLDALAARFQVRPGDMGENVLTRGIDLLALPVGARLALGADAVVELTGLRNPCAQIETFRAGLLAAVMDRDDQGRIVRKAGVMAIVLTGGIVSPGDAIRLTLPAQPHRALERV